MRSNRLIHYGLTISVALGLAACAGVPPEAQEPNAPPDGNGPVEEEEERALSNHAPQPSAGPDLTVAPGERVQLSGGDTTDADGDQLAYQWVQTAGPVVEFLPNASGINVEFVAPAVQTTITELAFELVVRDGFATASDHVRVRVEP